jgi:hypothetical protein
LGEEEGARGVVERKEDVGVARDPAAPVDAKVHAGAGVVGEVGEPGFTGGIELILSPGAGLILRDARGVDVAEIAGGNRPGRAAGEVVGSGDGRCVVSTRGRVR